MLRGGDGYILRPCGEKHRCERERIAGGVWPVNVRIEVAGKGGER